MGQAEPAKRTAMFHVQLAMGADMASADGWQLPAQYGEVAQEAVWLRDTVGISDISSIGKLRVVGSGAAELVAALLPHATELASGVVGEGDLPAECGDGKLLAARLAHDEFLLLTPPNRATALMDSMPGGPSCAHIADVTSGFSGVSIIGPGAERLLSRITQLDVSSAALPDLACAQARFAGIQALLLHRDTHGIATRHLYASREYGEYLWEALIEAAKHEGGGPVGTEALAHLV